MAMIVRPRRPNSAAIVLWICSSVLTSTLAVASVTSKLVCPSTASAAVQAANSQRAERSSQRTIEEDDLRIDDERASQRHERALADAEVVAVGVDGHVEREARARLVVIEDLAGLEADGRRLGEQVRAPEGVVKPLVIVLVEWIEIVAQRALRDQRRLERAHAQRRVRPSAG